MKIIRWQDFNKVKKRLAGKKIVLVGGCFDIFHFGHLIFLKKAKETGDFLLVALESDEFIRKNKKREPIHNQNQRSETLASIEDIDLVIKLPYFSSDKDYDELVSDIKPSVIAVSANDSKLENKKRQALQTGAKLKVVTSFIKGFSSKKILRKLS